MDRQMRVFVSSTFRDMDAERNILVSRVFPRLRALCRERQTEFVGVDLRWGVTASQAERSETVEICMREIDRCFPYFVGILGQRYGWVPDGAAVSVTEMEIERGALSEAGRKASAFFYLRSPGLSQSLCGDTDADARQEALIERVRRSGHPAVDGYTDLECFAQRILADLTRCADRDFPPQAPADPLSAEDAAQRYEARQRARGFLGREADLKRLTAHLHQGGLLLVRADTGLGKSALAARWSLDIDPDAFVVCHFFGGTGDNGWEQPARRILWSLKEAFKLPFPLPEDREGLRRAMTLSLRRAASSGRKIVLVLDGLDTLRQDEQYGLTWLPEELPPNVSVVATLGGGWVYDRLRNRPHGEWPLKPLTAAQRRKAAAGYLSRYAKALDTEQLAMIGRARQAGNPLYLTTLLSEIRHVGRFETLSAQLEAYLHCTDVRELFQRALLRFETDYDADRQEVTARVFRLLCASRGGLTEDELYRILEDVPQAVVLLLLLAMEPFVIRSRGAIRLASDAYQTAAARRYYRQPEQLAETRRQLIRWYEANPEEPRRDTELPWLYGQCGDWARLRAYLSNPKNFSAVWRRNRFEAKELWVSVIEGGQPGPAGAYEGVCRESHDPETMLAVAAFLVDAGEPDAAEPLLHRITNEYGKNKQLAVQAHGLLGNLKHRGGWHAEAETQYGKQYRIAKETGDRYEQQRALGNLGMIAQQRGQLSEAETLYRRVARLADAIGHTGCLQIALGRLGGVLFARNALNEAREQYLRQLKLCENGADREGEMQASAALGLIALRQNRPDEAESRFGRQADIGRALSQTDGLQNALGNLAAAASAKGDLAEAERRLREKLALCRRTGLFSGQQNALANLAALALLRGEPGEAVPFARERCELCLAHRALPAYAEALHGLADALYADGDTRQALEKELDARALAAQHGMRRLLDQIAASPIITETGGNNDVGSL